MLLAHDWQERKIREYLKFRIDTQDLQTGTEGEMHEFGILEKIAILFFDENKKVGFDMQVQTEEKGPCTYVLR